MNNPLGSLKDTLEANRKVVEEKGQRDLDDEWAVLSKSRVLFQ